MNLLLFVTTIIVTLLCGLYVGIIYILKQNELRYQREAPKLPSTHEEMVAMAMKKADEKMTDEEYNIKYGALRHETYRVSSIPRNYYDKVGMFLHYAEIYLRHFGYANLEKNVAIVKPIIIIGDFRSGTSNLERLIVHHKDVAAFTFTHTFIWQAPGFFDAIIDWLGEIRRKNGGGQWIAPQGPGIYYPHTSNVLLNRRRPMELEIAWQTCLSNLGKNRNNNWNELDTDKNKDNNSNEDLLTEEFDDPAFEHLLKSTIRMLLYHYKAKRFIWKNPLNGFRIGYLHKLFPDAKFIHIARNPVKTCKSQILLEQGNCRGYYIDEKEFRENNMRPPHPKNHYDAPRNSWSYLFHGQYPNDLFFQYWYPRVFPRTIPEYKKITGYLKQGKKACCVAQTIAQHERVALEAFKRCKLEEGKNLFTMYQEDLLDNAFLVATKLFSFLELPLTKQELIAILEKEDFPNGQAPIYRIQSATNNENEISFGDETSKVYEILDPCFQRYRNRKQNLNFYCDGNNNNNDNSNQNNK